MLYLLAALTILVLIPLIMALFFRTAVVARKVNEILEDLQKLQAYETDIVKRRGGPDAIIREIQSYYGKINLIIPVILLTCLYAISFLMCWSFLAMTYDETRLPALFPEWLLFDSRPILIAIIGVYLFNTGTLIRRLYLSDLTEHVFWTSINRLLLTVGLSTTLNIPDSIDQNFKNLYYFVFFVIGFLANEYLRWAMEQAIRLLKLRQARAADLPLQMIQGINIWKEYRLEEEGIENVQNLATADVIDLAIKTHYNLRTLLDWIDQAVLFDRFGEKAAIIRDQALIGGVIDLAWQSPEYTGNDTTAQLLGTKLGLESHFVAQIMNSLFEDAHVQTLWQLWQTRPDAEPRLRAAA